jgi:hypothetical protein
LNYDESTTFTSHRYRVWLTIAVLLFLITLTTVVVLIIIGNARAETREEEFENTLTAVWSDISATQTALVESATPAPVVIAGQFDFVPAAGSPAYSGLPICDRQVVAGRVSDQDGLPLDGFDLYVWGDFITPRIVATGPVTGHEPGQWTLTFSNMLNRRVWVQVVAGDRHLSMPVEVIFSREDCSRNRADIIFERTAAPN